MKHSNKRVHPLRYLLASVIVVTGLITLIGSGGGGGGGEPPPGILTPVQVTDALTFTDIGVANQHVCAVATNGGTYCWGKNEYGELGTAVAMDTCLLPFFNIEVPCTGTPVVVESSPEISYVDGSIIHTCSLDSSGSAYCWGYGIGGQLGDGAQTDSIYPVPVAGGYTFTQLSVGIGGTATCSITIGGLTYCWGPGLLGDGTDASSVPVQVLTPETFTAISVGDSHACGLAASGQVYCWGNNWYGQLGIGSAGGDGGVMKSLTPTAVTGGLVFATISAGAQHTCALTQSGEAYCWGGNSVVGAENLQDAYISSPIAVSSSQSFDELDAGFDHTCAVTAQGTAYCWGHNLTGNLGNNTLQDSQIPVPVVQGDVRFQNIVAGGNTCALAQDSTAYCWGSNGTGESGRPGLYVIQ